MTNRAIHANVSDEAFNQWTAFAEENGVSLTGVVEALGAVFEAHSGGASSKASKQLLDDLVVAARKVDVARRRRGRNSKD